VGFVTNASLLYQIGIKLQIVVCIKLKLKLNLHFFNFCHPFLPETAQNIKAPFCNKWKIRFSFQKMHLGWSTLKITALYCAMAGEFSVP
jgi:hypothetical protein